MYLISFEGKVTNLVNHKRGRPKNRRAGCLLCKSWKMNGAGKNSKEYERPADRRRRLGCEQDLQGE